MIVPCWICKKPMNDRVHVRYTVNGTALCSAECVVAYREKTGSW